MRTPIRSRSQPAAQRHHGSPHTGSCYPAIRVRAGFLSLIVSALVLGALVLCCTIPAGADAQSQLDQARAAMARGDRAAAITHFEQAVAQDPRLAAAHRWLSRLYADQGRLENALDSAAAAVLLDPDPADVKHLQHLLDLGLPESMNRATPDAFDLPKTMITIEPGGDRLAGVPGPRDALVVARPDRDAPAKDRRYGWSFNRTCYGYVLDRRSGRWRKALVAHYDVAAGPDRRRLATECAALLLRAECLREAYLGLTVESSAASRRPLEVWLADGGTLGAESWGADIYLCAAATPRPPLEWVRQVIHEYGHVALPGVDHFNAPERWANGRLGEQLLARWLAQSRERGEPHPWLAQVDLQRLQVQADRCLRAFLRQGPASLEGYDSSAASMDYYLGFADYVEQAFGPRVLSDAMRLTVGSTCAAFVVGVQEALRRASPQGIELRALAHGQVPRVIQWVYLPAARWRAMCTPGATVTFNQHSITSDETDIGRVVEGWHAVAMPPEVVVRFVRAGG